LQQATGINGFPVKSVGGLSASFHVPLFSKSL